MDSDYGVEKRDLSELQKLRSTYQPPLPLSLQGTSVRVEYGDATTATDPSEADTIRQIFPHTYAQPLVRFLSDTPDLPSSSSSSPPPIRVGVVFCGRQSPGGHNVIWGIHDALKTHNPKSVLLGFLGGSEGLFAQRTLEVTDDILSTYKNQGGYDLLGRTKDQIRTNEQINAALAACTSLKLDGLVIIGGVTSNTDAAQLAETFVQAKCPTKVVGVPVTLNGDLKNRFVETNVGFDTICKVNSQLISNVCTDALSAEKYYYFIRLMGRKASHVALECTLQSHPNMVILGEEVSASKLTLFDLTNQICDAVQDRAEQDKHHGVILLPEGLIESIPEVYALLQEIHGLHKQGVHVDKISSQLSPPASAFFELLPSFIKKQLLLFPESDDSAQLSQIETEKLLAHLVEAEMNKRLKEGTYKGKKFNAICHFFGYQARGSLPSKFDCDYAFVLGHICYHILAAGLSGYLATLTNLKNPVNKWRCSAAPITAMMTVKHFGYGPVASTPGKPALHPAVVDLKGKTYELLSRNAKKFLMDDVYRNPGPLQFDGPSADSKAVTLCAEDQEYISYFKEDEVMVDKIESESSPPLVLEAENCKSTAETAAATTSEWGSVPQCHEQEKLTNLESPTVLELREGNNVPDADVLADSNNSCPNSKPEEEEASMIKYPNGCHIQDATVQKDSSQEKVTNSESLTVMELAGGVNVPETNVPADSENSSLTSQPEKEEASVTKDPIDCDIQDATIQKDSFESDNNLSPSDDSMKAETEVDCQETIMEPLPAATSETGDVAQSHEQEKATNSESLTVLKSREDDNVPEADVVADSKDSCPTSIPEGEEDSVTNDPIDCQIQDAAVQKDSSENDNSLRSPDDSVRAETEVDNQEATMEVLPPETSETGDVPQSHEQEEAIISKSFTVLESREEDNVPEADVVAVSKVSCPTSIPEVEDASVTKDPIDCQIQDTTVKKDSYEIENKFSSPDVSLKPETEGDVLLCPVDNAAGIEVEVTNASDKVNGIPKADKTSDSSCTDNTTEACSHSLATGVVIPAIVSCHVNGSLVYNVGRSNVADLISDSEIHKYSSTNGMDVSFTDVAVASQSQVQFGSFVPAVYQVNGGCRDDSNKMITCQEEVNGFEHFPRGNFSKRLPPSKRHPVVVEESVAGRPFNFLIRMPRYYDDELDDQIRQAELQVAEKTQKREAVKLEMQKIREDVQQARSDYTEAVSEGRAARQLVKSKRVEIDSVQSIINRVKNAISVDDIDVRIKHMEHMMQHETLPLKEEKQFIREIKQLKHYREQLSANMGSQDEVREAIDQKGQIEEKLKTLRKDLDRLKKEVTTAEAKIAAADIKHKDEKNRLEEVYHQHIAAQRVRQEAYINLQNLRKQFYEKNARFRLYREDTTAANDCLSSGDKMAFHRLCLDQVEEMMELWNKDDEFRKDYIRCNARSTIGRLRTMDGRALGPGEESPVVVSGRNKSSRDKVGQVDLELPLVSAADLEKREEQVPAAQAAETTGGKSVEKLTGKANMEGKKPGKLTLMNGSPPINSFVGISETLEEESNKKQLKEEEEVARREEQLRRAEEEAKLKEQRRLEEIAKAREALERKRKIAEKAQIRAEVRAQKEAEQKDKEKEKRAKKKERKKGGASDSSFEGGDTIVPVSEVTAVTTMKEVEAKEGPAASKRSQKPYTKQQNKLKAASSIPPPLRNKNKRRMQQWMWACVLVAVVVAVILVANMGFYPNHLGRNNRHPGF